MKILYLTKGDHVDYQNDCLLIGLKEMFGADVVDYNKQHHNYDSFCKEKAKTMYGMGMTVTRVLPDLEVDRTDITSKIKNKFFDYIVYGSIWRFNSYLHDILKFYSPNEIIAVDGEDEPNIHQSYNSNILYFKRELLFKKQNIFPISFSIPTIKTNLVNIKKTRDIAICDPRNKSTYIYTNEEDYYKGYQESLFGITIKKAGWDCMRHYEILGNGCLPLFLDINNCPNQTLQKFPKELCIQVLNDLKQEKFLNVYEKYFEKFKTYFLQNCTTLASAKYFIETLYEQKN